MRLTFWYVAAMMVVLGVYVFGVYTVVSRSVLESLDQQLRRDFQWVAASVFQMSDGSFAWNEPDVIVGEEGLPWVQVWNAEGTTVLFRNSEAQRRRIQESQVLAAQADDRTVSVATEAFPMRVLSRRGGIGPERVVIQVARSEEAMLQELRDLELILVFGLPVAVALAGLGGYSFARGVLAPIEQMTDRARTITAERLSDRLPVSNPDNEMGRLATVFNETLGRLQESFDQMRRFTADVSHELRTPLTAIRSVGEVGLRGHRDETAYRSIIGSMLEEVDRLASLVDRLLTLSRAETHQATLSLDDVDLAPLAEDVASHLGVLAEEKRQSITIEPLARLKVRSDRLVLRQAVINLVDNAIKFTPSAGAIRIRLSETPSDAIVDVIDSGPGVPVEARERIFDRFYRTDDNDVGGTGLGLSLAKGAVEALGGRLTLEGTGPTGSTFRIAVPRKVRRAKGEGQSKLEVGARV
jgi:heavy metal sensor kinase